MADQPLVSPEEVASVLSTGEDRDTAMEDAGSGVYSLRRPLTLAPEEEQLARQRAAELARALGHRLSRELEVDIELELQGFQQQQSEAAVHAMPAPTWMIGFALAEGGGLALVLDPVCGLTLVELALGGTGNSQTSGRAPTPLEARVMRNLGAAMLGRLERPDGARFERCSFESGELPSTLAAPGEMVGTALLKLRFGEVERNGMLLVTAGLLREPPSDPGDASEDGAGPMMSRLARVHVETRPVLPAGRVTLNDLMELAPGVVLRLEAPAESRLELRVEGRCFCKGRVSRDEAGSRFTVHRRRGLAESPPAEHANETQETEATWSTTHGNAFADLELAVEVWLGREEVSLDRLAALRPGGILPLSHDPDGTVDLVVNGSVVASGELVVVDGRFGFRVTSTARQKLADLEQDVGAGQQAEPPQAAQEQETAEPSQPEEEDP